MAAILLIFVPHDCDLVSNSTVNRYWPDLYMFAGHGFLRLRPIVWFSVRTISLQILLWIVMLCPDLVHLIHDPTLL